MAVAAAPGLVCCRVSQKQQDRRRRGPAHRAGGPGVRHPAPRQRVQPRPCEARHRPPRPAADRFGQRADPRALPAAVLAARQLRQRASRRAGLGPQEPPRSVRVLGARSLAAAAGLPAAVALAHERAPATPAQQGQAATCSRARRRPTSTRCAARVEDRGPLAASELADGGPQARAVVGLERRQARARMAVLRGRSSRPPRGAAAFERVYDLTERVLPADGPGPADALARGSAARAAAPLRRAPWASPREFDLRDYFRLPVADTKARLAELVEAGDLLPVDVEGWRPACLSRSRRPPAAPDRGACTAGAVRSADLGTRPHERIFDFFYRIEIYTPVAKRKHGYYVLPFLLDDRLVGRVDLKSDRANSKLLVPAAHLEPGVEARDVAAPAARGAAPDGRLARPRGPRPASRWGAGAGVE